MRHMKVLPKIVSSFKYPARSSVVRLLTPQTEFARTTSVKSGDESSSKKEKDPKPSGEIDAKAEPDPVKIPGFVHPEIKCDEGFFTQQAKQQIEEQKKKEHKPTLNNPDIRP